MAANSCDLYPEINGEPSKLYQDLLGLVHDRKLVNYIYVSYLQQGVATQMDHSYSRNNQNQHNALDVYEFFNVGKVITKHKEAYEIALERAGSVDNKGNRISYTDGKQALEKADAFNNSDLGDAFVASVYQHENVFQIYVERKDSMSVEEAGITKEQLKAWDTVTQAFNLKHVNINDLTSILPTLFSPVRVMNMLEWIKNLQMMRPSDIRILSVTDLKIALTFNINDQTVQRLLGRYKDIDTVANELYNYLKTGNASPADAARFQGVLGILLSLGGIDANALIAQVEAESTNLRANDRDFLVAKTLKSYGDKINPNLIENIKNLDDRITSLSEAALRSVQVLARKLDDAKNDKDERKALELEKKISKLIEQIDGKHYFGGTLELIQNVTSDIADLMQAIQNPPLGTKLEQLIATSNNFKKLKDLVENYYDILLALSDLNKIIINENISSRDEQNLQSVAKQALDNLIDVKKILDSSKQSLAVDILTEFLGDSVINGVPVAVLASHAAEDTKFFDQLFNSTEISSPLVSAVGSIIRRAQQERDKKVIEFNNRILRATNKLQKAGYTNEDWMYEPDGTIISDIDWSSYFKSRETYKAQLKSQGITGFTYDSMLLDWEEQNTEDRVVDKVNNRTERVPNSLYRKQMIKLDAAQQEYYDTMMQIKGELGTCLPSYARDHYTPPQIRLELKDALKDAVRNYKGKYVVRRIVKVIKERFKDMITWREDEEYVDQNGYYHGGYSSAHSNPNGTQKKRIPIFYRGTIEDQSMLDKNFSRAIGHMASTALGYDSLSKIESMVEYMRDFIENKDILDKDSKGNVMVDIIEGKRTKIAQKISKLKGRTSLTGILDGIIDTQMYGTVDYKKTWYNKLIKSIISLNSSLSLSLNIKGATVNRIIGDIQTFIEAHGGEFYNKKDWLAAEASVMNPKNWIGVVEDTLNGTKLSIDTLINDRFNVQQDVFSDLRSRHFYMNKLERGLESIDSMFLYGLSEYPIHQINLRAILRSEKVLLNGKQVSLREIFDKTTPVDGVSELIIKPGATRLDGSPITNEYLDSIMNLVKLVNQEHHGAMADEDKGTIHRMLLGKAIMNFRQWMVKHYSRRYKAAQIDPLTGKLREGYYRTFALTFLATSLDYTRLRWLSVKLLSGSKFAKNMEKFQGTYHWKNIKSKNDRMRIANVRKAIAEHIIAAVLLNMKWIIDDDDDDNKSWREYQTLGLIDRMLLDVLGSIPLLLLYESTKLINKPIPAINTFNKLVYPITGIGDIGEEYKRGRFKGENKYWHNIRYRVFPPIQQLDYFFNPEDDKNILSMNK